ncbi:fungal trichothecene efflux pump [Microdochium trichocladiopsis]|uniref:Fungal trichothecene efflux pump n=1 Tax=Microdochium trichocladiopsis TaxID=1682393 RepID=A0A9P8YEP6_9PEZI|nr:fungal trichothecene efflux pump [Microdochium trichocladiopsis]KAH7037517.1 fungal trichothecene efflux pump [Microdochium trichocladiopsis]
MPFIAMALLWTASQIPLYLFAGISPIIYGDIGGVDKWIWFVTGNLLGSAAICPFSGALSDLLGRRYVALGGVTCVLAGQVICSLAMNMDVFIAGMTISGIGAGINELTALAATAEMAPTSKRGFYVACLILTVLPFCASVLWAQLIAHYAHWRFVGLVTSVWSLLALSCLAWFYFPPPRINSDGLSRVQILRRIDYIGGALSIVGIVLLTCGLLFGGYQYSWSSAHTLVPLVLGIITLALFIIWETRLAPFPMFPRRLGQAKRNFTLTLIITFISGANFFAVLMIWPPQAHNMYGHDPVGVGIRGMPFACAVLGGAVGSLFLMSYLRRWRHCTKYLLAGSSCLMTAGCGALAAARLDNISAVYGILFLAGLGVGGIVIPASLLSTIICPDDLIATVSALTLAVRVIGGTLGFAVYYNVFAAKLGANMARMLVPACAELGITAPETVGRIVALTAGSLTDKILDDVLHGDVEAWRAVVLAGQRAFEASYPWVYYASIPFGVVSIIASLFVTDTSGYMDDHVAVVM